jgi:hypothetical protein
MAYRRREKKPATFEFEYQEKKYIIRRRYECQPATIVLDDGQILYVSVWQISLPYQPLPYQVETFDPLSQSAAELAKVKAGLVAELVQAPDNGSSNAAKTKEQPEA